MAVLDWGLGHATRCLPLIKQLEANSAIIMVASSGSALQLLQQELPGRRFFELPAYAPVYPQNGSMVWQMGAQLPHFIKTIKAEHRALEEIVQREHVQVVVSDNRYGCYSKKVKSIFITHQLHLLMPAKWKWLEPWVNYFNHRQMALFAECWIPADDDNLIPRLLQKPAGIKTRYIGYLSRFAKKQMQKKYRVAVIASGPEPQRSMFVTVMRQQLLPLTQPAFLVNGDVQQGEEVRRSGHLFEVGYFSAGSLNDLICESELVICRSGYSSVMDLMQLGAKAVFVPTPGQTEQEYIATVLMERGIGFYMPQDGFNIGQALKEAEQYRGFEKPGNNSGLLQQAVDTI